MVLAIALVFASLAAHAEGTDTGWPRQFTNGETITVYQPQVEKWAGNQLVERAAVSIQTTSSSLPIYGVVRVSARTEVDRANRLVTLEDAKVLSAEFPSAGPSIAHESLEMLKKSAPSLLKQISLDRLQADLAITKSERRHEAPALPNEPPRIIFAKSPSVLILVDGAPVLRDSAVTGILRVINTRALILFDQAHAKYYLYVGDRWMQAASLTGSSWTPVSSPSDELDRAKQAAVSQKQVDLMENLKNSPVPRVYVSTKPAELIQTRGEPQYKPLGHTHLLYVENTSNEVFLDSADRKYYILVAGRWYRSTSLEGPWHFISAKHLPSDFAKISPNHPKGAVLASVAGTPQAKEAAISNEIPQTATIDRERAGMVAEYDGAPRFEPIQGTSLKYAANSPQPVIEVQPDQFYAVQNGVWFSSTSPDGPWAVATSVPPAIYTIPPSSRLYNVTFVQVYGATPDVVYEGYTPGYLGSYYCSDGVVVYGTGYAYPPWVGTVWYGAPVTYGFGVGWGIGFGWGFYAGAGFYPWWGPWWYSPAVQVTQVTSAPGTAPPVNTSQVNVYQSWKNAAVRNTADRDTPALSTHVPTGLSTNNVYASRNGQVYRNEGRSWERVAPGSNDRQLPAVRNAPEAAGQVNSNVTVPREVAPVHELNQDRTARALGEQQSSAFHSRAGIAAPPAMSAPAIQPQAPPPVMHQVAPAAPPVMHQAAPAPMAPPPAPPAVMHQVAPAAPAFHGGGGGFHGGGGHR